MESEEVTGLENAVTGTPDVEENSKEQRENSEDLDPNDDEFVGFSPPPSPGPTTAHRTVEKLESELQLLNADGKKVKDDKELSPIKAESSEFIVSPVRDEKFPATIVDDIPPLKKRGSRASSPAESTSSRGSYKKAVSVSSRESRGSVNSEKKDAAFRYLLPFEKGWKREVNVRIGGVEIVYIHPLGLRLKSLRDVSQHISEGLTIENFTFTPEPLNAGAEYEIILKDNLEVKETALTPSVRKSGRVPVPSSNYKIVERMEEESRKRGNVESPMAPPPKREKLVIKLKPTRPSVPSGNDIPTGHRNKSVSARKKAQNPDTGNYVVSRRKDEPVWSPDKLVEETPRLNCSIACPLAMGLIPTLQCCVCLCLYHPECAEVGRTDFTRNIHGYICKNCRAKPDNRKPAAPAEAPVPPAPTQPPPPPAPPAVPQIIVTLNRRRFVMVPNLSATPAAATPGPALPPQSATTTLPLADLPASEPAAAVKPEGAATKKPTIKKELPETTMVSFMRNLCSGYTGLQSVFKYLTVAELLRAARVCRLWKDLAENPSLWRTVRMKNSQVTDWEAFAASLSRHGTRHLDLRKILPAAEGRGENWDECYSHLASVTSLEHLEMNRVPISIVTGLLKARPGLRVFNGQISADSEPYQGLDIFSTEHRLEVLRLKHQGQIPLPLGALDLSPLKTTLQVLSLLSFSNWDNIDTSCIGQLTDLTELELGDCTSLRADFPPVLRSLTKLERVRLETGSVESPTADILYSLSSLPALNQLELVNFDGLPAAFDDALPCMRNIRSLLLIPTFKHQAGTKISSVLKGIYRLRETLSVFVWVFTFEFLHVAELYVDKYSPLKTRKSPQAASCVPILMPLPLPEEVSSNSLLWQGAGERYGSAGTIAVVPMAELQEMLKDGMPNTKTLISKLPAQSTSRQTLKDLLP